MELRQLKYFVKTAETLNFSEAARALFITQSTLSQQIRCLERYGFRQVGTWQFDDASALISRLANNSWRLPYGMNAAAYRP